MGMRVQVFVRFDLRSVVFITFCSLAVSARAQERVADRLTLSLADALERASQRAPELVLAERQVLETGARRAGAGIIMPTNPALRVEARPAVTGGGFISDLGYAASLDTTFDLGGAPAARVREVERDVELSRAQAGAQRVLARLRVVAAYLGAQLGELRAVSAREALELGQRVLAAAEKRIEVGAGAEFERASAQLEIARIEALEQGAVRERDEALMQLRDALDLVAEQPLELTTRVDDPTPLPPVANFVAAAREHHPELFLLQARVRALQATRVRLDRELFPKLGLYAGVDAAPVSPVFGILGVSGELPVAQRNQGPRAVVARALETEQTRQELLQRRIVREVYAAWNAHERRRAEYALLSGSALPAATRSFELAEAGWRAGRFDWFRVALAARALVELRSTRLDALAALWTQRIALARATGGDVP